MENRILPRVFATGDWTRLRRKGKLKVGGTQNIYLFVCFVQGRDKQVVQEIGRVGSPRQM